MATRETTLPAQSTVSAATLKFGDFKPVVGTTGSTLYVLKTEANHSKSMGLLEESGLRPLKYQEVLPLLMKDEALKNSLKGKWFYLAGEGLNEDGIYTVNDKGELAKIEGEELSLEKKVRAWSGKNPLSLCVYSGNDAAYHSRRFCLVAAYDPHGDAPVVVGVPKERSEPEPSQAEALSWLVTLRKTADLTESSVAKLEETTKPDLLEPVKALIRKVRSIDIKEDKAQ